MAISITQKIIDDIAGDIQAGRLQPGDKLPSSRELRGIYNCSISPVADAIRTLKALGLVEGSPGVGVFVAVDKSTGP